MSYRFNAGKVFGTVPFRLMEVHPGNELSSPADIFNMMTRYMGLPAAPTPALPRAPLRRLPQQLVFCSESSTRSYATFR